MTVLIWTVLIYLFTQPVQIPKSSGNKNSLQFSLEHPSITNPSRIDQTLTIPVENILIGMPGVKHVYSMTKPGSVDFTLQFNSEPDPEYIQSWIYEQMRNHSVRLPANLRLPIIQKSEENTQVHLSGHYGRIER